MIQAITKPVNEPRLTPIKAIRKYCKTVCAGSSKETFLCTVLACPLYGFRQGKHSARAGKWVGPRSRKGRFLPKSDRAAGKNLIKCLKESYATGAVVLDDSIPSGTEVNEEGIAIERAGKVRIQQRGNNLLITLIQEGKPNERST